MAKDNKKAKVEHLSIVKIATVGNGVQEFAFDAKTLPLTEVVTAAGLTLSNMQVRLKREGKRRKINKVEGTNVKDGDIIFLIPPVRGGSS